MISKMTLNCFSKVTSQHATLCTKSNLQTSSLSSDSLYTKDRNCDGIFEMLLSLHRLQSAHAGNRQTTMLWCLSQTQ